MAENRNGTKPGVPHRVPHDLLHGIPHGVPLFFVYVLKTVKY